MRISSDPNHSLEVRRQVMALDPVGYFGTAVSERKANGLVVNLSSLQPGPLPFHVHADPAFSILITGRAVDRSRRIVHQQPLLTVIYHPTSEPHANEIGPGGVIAFNLGIARDWLARHQLGEAELGGYLALPPSAGSRLVCLRLLGTALRPGPRADADLETLTLELLEPLVKAHALSASASPPRWLVRADEFLHTHFRSAISLRSAAREAGVHPVYFARIFRRHHGCPVSAYIRALRLVEAGEAILERGGTIAGAACAAGFADQAHMARCFARIVGFSPRDLLRLRALSRST
jgi:AraC family transcriptional regulator